MRGHLTGNPPRLCKTLATDGLIMIKTVINEFKYGEGEGSLALSAPFSSASFSHGEGKFTVRADFTVEAADWKYAYIRIKDTEKLCEVRLGGETVYSGRFSGRVLNIPVKSSLCEGENTLELVFLPYESGVYPGLFGGVELLRFNGAIIDRVSVTEEFMSSGVNLHIGLDLLGSSDNVRAVATLRSRAGQIFYGGIARGKGHITIKDPLYWWPKDMGVQNLYTLTVNLYGDMEAMDTREFNIGIRNISIEGAALCADIGGASFLPMGAVYRTENMSDPMLSRNRMPALINSAARVGMNALLIKESDELPTESFFELCDAHGIVVIREMRSSRLENNAEELEMLARVANHPSMAIYNVVYDSGNSRLIKERLAKIAPNLAIRFSDKTLEYSSFPSIASERVISKYLSCEDENLFSEKMESAGAEQISVMLESARERYPYAGSFSDFVYLSSLNAAERIREKIISARIMRGALPAIYDGLGDLSGLICKSGIDEAAVWRATHYLAAGFFAPVCLYANHLGQGRVEFFVSNEKRQSFSGSLEFRIADSENRTVYSGSQPCTVERATAKEIFSFDFGQIIANHENEYYLECYLRDTLGVFSRSVTLFVPEKYFKFKNPDIKAEIVGTDRRFSVTLISSAFARGVELSFDKTDAVFYDNYFDITASAPQKIQFTVVGGIENAEHLASTLRIKSVYDVKRR